MKVEINKACLALSKAVYGEEDNIDRNLWRQLPVNGISSDGIIITTEMDSRGYHYYSTPEGLQAAVYQNTETKDLVIAYRGTEASSIENFLEDASADIALSVNKMNPQFIQAEKFCEAAVDIYCDKKEDEKPITTHVSLTGHSLGGALAQLVAEKKIISAYTFNAPGMKYFIEHTKGISYNSLLCYSHITNYIIMNDYVGNFKEHLGRELYIQPVPIGINPELTTTNNAATDTHNSILSYREEFFGPLYTLKDFGMLEGFALWYYDANNPINKLSDEHLDEKFKKIKKVIESLSILGEYYFNRAINVIKEQIGNPINQLKYVHPRTGELIEIDAIPTT